MSKSYTVFRVPKIVLTFLRIARAEDLLLGENRAEAIRLLEQVRKEANGGMLAAEAAQTLALLYAEEDKQKEAYDLLLPLKEQLSGPALCLLHHLASEMNHSELVAELSVSCYQLTPTREVAIRNARAFAALHQSEPAGGWLQTALQYGPMNLKTLLEDAIFDQVRNDPSFRKFVEPS